MADDGERLIGGWPIRIRNTTGELAFETMTISDATRQDYGHWYLTRPLAPGPYLVEEGTQEGWAQTCPGTTLLGYLIDWHDNGTYELLYPVSAGLRGLDFGNLPPYPGHDPTATATLQPGPIASSCLLLPIVLHGGSPAPIATATPTDDSVMPTATATPTPPGPCNYVGNSNTGKLHYPSCTYASRISPEHRVCFATCAEAIAQGYVPCQICKPCGGALAHERVGGMEHSTRR